ncbi:MAG: hypothetical protein EAZ60_23635 [Oscillatoriales cyanobacterium]|nr:MAG: hypothetical protein EAZ60_23635 [Oscillatoriales cyanobacterium]
MGTGTQTGTTCKTWLFCVSQLRRSRLCRFPFVQGKICPTRKLKPEQVQQIRYLLGEGISKAEIARRFAISRSQIILLSRGEIYRDIL